MITEIYAALRRTKLYKMVVIRIIRTFILWLCFGLTYAILVSILNMKHIVRFEWREEKNLTEEFCKLINSNGTKFCKVYFKVKHTEKTISLLKSLVLNLESIF